MNARSFLGFTLGVGTDVSVLFPVLGDPDTSGRVMAGAGVDAERHNGQFNVFRPHLPVNGEWRVARFATVFAEGSAGSMDSG